ncbi:MAG: patatin-like phospholipase family protein [Alphaproteobacteria bacterium]|nr:patatin-like phospholipase family protein [Alphaproteobacteria bacterium]MDX5370074.1 patatin-like phospholipase family protein [Alphaproteobacteria bacterium]MDX5464647.1 patatin-like phospholipase family protein [Alphaproteobacteria bacterium]
MKPSARPRIGLALGAGIARGWAHIGILQALGEAGIRPHVIAGTSIGAVAGAAHAGGALPALEAFARSLTARGVLRYLDVRLGSGGLIAGERLAALLGTDIPVQRIEELSPRFVAVATDLDTGNEVWLTEGPLVPAIRASYALPGVFPPVEIDGRHLVDGALVNPVPVSVCRALGADIVIGVTFDIRRGIARHADTSVEEFEARAEAGAPPASGGLLATTRTRMLRQILGRGRTGPGLSTVMINSLSIMLDRIARARLAGDPPDQIISPRMAHVGLLDFDRADASIRAGRDAVREILPDLKALIAAAH